MSRRIISADSHITEPPDTYAPRMDPRFRDRAPHLEHREDTDVFVIPGMKVPVPMGLVAAAIQHRNPDATRESISERWLPQLNRQEAATS